MKRLLVPFMLVLVVLSASVIGVSAQTADTAAAADHTAPSYDMKAQSLADLGVVQKKMVDLANAIPAEGRHVSLSAGIAFSRSTTFFLPPRCAEKDSGSCKSDSRRQTYVA